MKKDLSNFSTPLNSMASPEWFALNHAEKSVRQNLNLEAIVSDIVMHDTDLAEWLVLLGGGEIDI